MTGLVALAHRMGHQVARIEDLGERRGRIVWEAEPPPGTHYHLEALLREHFDTFEHVG